MSQRSCHGQPRARGVGGEDRQRREQQGRVVDPGVRADDEPGRTGQGDRPLG